MMRRFGKLAIALCAAAAVAAPVLAVSPVPATADQPSLTRAMNSDVLDYYYHYECPAHISGHNMDYNKSYKLLTFQHGYAYDGFEVIDKWKAKNCSCGSGTVYYRHCLYHTW